MGKFGLSKKLKLLVKPLQFHTVSLKQYETAAINQVSKVNLYTFWTRPILLFLFLFFMFPVFHARAQTNALIVSASVDATEFPQWAKDIRRWEIVAFGSYPFTMFTTTFGMDMYRWSQANGMDFSDTGRRYAPWPLKSAGAVDMTNKEYETTMIIAASMSAVIAVADLIIVQIKRHKARQRAESLPVGTTIISRRPWPPVPEPEGLEEDEDAGITGTETEADGNGIAEPGFTEPLSGPDSEALLRDALQY